MHKFVRSLITEWRRLDLPLSGAAVVVAVSGGADSAALLAALCDLRDRGKHDNMVIAAHFDHGLRGDDSTADSDFVEKLAGRLGTKFVTGAASVRRRGNLEQNAREARYTFLAQTAAESNAGWVAAGHTRNDQAETFLMNLIRGSGANGLSAMKPVRPLSVGGPKTAVSVMLVRPLLRWAKREDTETFCRELSIDFRHDSMNDDTAFRRVAIRKTLIPLLEDFNPKIIDTLSATAERIGDQNAASGNRRPAAAPKVGELASLPIPEMRRELRAWLESERGHLRGIGLKHIEAIERLITSRRSGKTVELPLGQMVSKQNGRLVFAEIAVEK